MSRRALIVCPGRGSYGRESLGSLANLTGDAAAIVDACDAWRADRGAPTLRELDAAASFAPSRHVAGEHASLLTFAVSLADRVALQDVEVVAVTGNSMGWYTALAASGALPVDDAIELVDTMGAWQQDHVIGGQIMWPLTGADRTIDLTRVAEVDQAIADARAAGHHAWWSIRLGSHAVIGADDGGCAFLLTRLPAETRGTRKYPTRLPLHSAFHTPLMQATSTRALDELGALGFRAPAVPLIDGQGTVWRPRWADPVAMRDYTLGAQVVDTYDLDLAVRAALWHTAPDVVIVLGPGEGLLRPVETIARGAGFAVEVRGPR